MLAGEKMISRILSVMLLLTVCNYAFAQDVLWICISPENVSIEGRILTADTSFTRLILELSKSRIISRYAIEVDTNVDFRTVYNFIWYFNENGMDSFKLCSNKYPDLWDVEPEKITANISKGDSLKLYVEVMADYINIYCKHELCDSIPDNNSKLDLLLLSTRLKELKAKYRKAPDISWVSLLGDYSISFGRYVDVMHACHRSGFITNAYGRPIPKY